MKVTTGIPQPFPYQGSKRKLAIYILPCIPDNTYRFIEPFAGSASITIAVAYNRKARRFWINDVHKPVAALWKDILGNPEAILDGYKKLWKAQLGNEKTFYNQVRIKFNTDHSTDCFLYLLARCVKAAIRYNRQGQFNNSPDNRRKGMQPEKMSANILFISEMLGGKTRITNKDYKFVLKQATSKDVVYMDPPYQGVCQDRDQRYCSTVLFNDFVQSLDYLNEKSVPYIVSYDGRTGDKVHGEILPKFLNLEHFEIPAGKSTQSTLLGKSLETYESLYLSEALMKKLGGIPDELKAEEPPYLFAL
jgi:DNA adenine methylase